MHGSRKSRRDNLGDVKQTLSQARKSGLSLISVCHQGAIHVFPELLYLLRPLALEAADQGGGVGNHCTQRFTNTPQSSANC